MRGLAAMGLVWAVSLLAVGAAGQWTAGTVAAGVLAAAMVVFAVGECLHGAIHAPLGVDLAPPQLVGRYLALSSLSWQVGWIVGPERGLRAPAQAAAALAGGRRREPRGRRRGARARAATARTGPPDPARRRRRRSGSRRVTRLHCENACVGDKRPPQYKCRACPASAHAESGRGPAPPSISSRARLTELHNEGLTSIHLDGPTHVKVQELATRFGWHPLDVEDVLSRRERPKVDVYTEDEPGYLFLVLHFPVCNASVGRLDAGRARRLRRVGLPRHASERRAQAGHAPVRAVPREQGAAAQPLLTRLGAAALRGARRPVRLLLPDPRQDRVQAAPDRRGDRRRGAAREGARPRHPQGEAGDHLLPQDRASPAPDAAPASNATSSVSCPRSSSSTSTTSSTLASGSGTTSTTTKRWSRRSRTRTSRSSTTSRTTSCTCSRSSAS